MILGLNPPKRPPGGKEKKGKKARVTVVTEAEAAAAAAEAAKAVEMAKAATRIQAMVRSRAARKAVKEAKVAAAALGRKKGHRGRGRGAKHKKGAKPKVPRPPTVSKAAADPSTSEHRAMSLSPPKHITPPALRISPKAHDQLQGWVTVAAGHECFVVKQTGRLPVQLRIQHEQHWNRRIAIDSERELEKAKMRDVARMSKQGTQGGTSIPHDHAVPGLSPRPIYWDHANADPQRIGFAYGGMYPGRRHAKGQLVEKHEVHFSVGVCGNYMLYVNLRQPHTPGAGLTLQQASKGNETLGIGGDWAVPGSPFALRVAPGKAYALTTSIPAESIVFTRSRWPPQVDWLLGTRPPSTPRTGGGLRKKHGSTPARTSPATR